MQELIKCGSRLHATVIHPDMGEATTRLQEPHIKELRVHYLSKVEAKKDECGSPYICLLSIVLYHDFILIVLALIASYLWRDLASSTLRCNLVKTFI